MYRELGLGLGLGLLPDLPTFCSASFSVLSLPKIKRVLLCPLGQFSSLIILITSIFNTWVIPQGPPKVQSPKEKQEKSKVYKNNEIKREKLSFLCPSSHNQ